MSNITGVVNNYAELLVKLNDFLTQTGHAWGKQFNGVGNGELVDYIGTDQSAAETITISFTDSSNFTVKGSLTGDLPNGAVDSNYSSSVINFKINSGSNAFAAGDSFIISTSPAWKLKRFAGCADANKVKSSFTDYEILLIDDSNYAQSSDTTAYINFEMVKPSAINKVHIRSHDSGRSPKNFELQFKDNEEDDYVTAQSWNITDWTVLAQDFILDNPPGEHKYWQLKINSSTGNQLYLYYVGLSDKVSDGYDISSHIEAMWQAPGLSGDKEINIGAVTHATVKNEVYNLAFSMSQDIDDSRSAIDQYNRAQPKVLALINLSFRYWIIANGQRFILITKLPTTFQFAYCGFGLQYELPSVHPYPAIVGASSSNLEIKSNSTDNNFRYPVNPGNGSLTAYYPDGQWREFDNTNINLNVWPAVKGYSTYYIWFDSLVDNLDGSKAIFPCVLYSQNSPVSTTLTHIFGEFDGVYWVSGFNNSAESTIKYRGNDYIVINNIYRSQNQDFAAIIVD